MNKISLCSIDKNVSADIYPELGGLCASLKINEQELLYWPDGLSVENYSEISAGLPFIFPICGRLQKGVYTHNEREYALPIHGFAHSQKWSVLEQNTDSVLLELSANDQTKKHYPFEFVLQLHYQVNEKGLQCEVVIANHGQESMPYSAGFHPYYRLLEGAVLDCYPIKQLQYNDQLDAVIGEQALLKFPLAAADPVLNEQLFELSENHALSLTMPDGLTLTQNSGALSKYLQIYAPENGGFICLEPWTGYPNALNDNAASVLPVGGLDRLKLQVSYT